MRPESEEHPRDEGDGVAHQESQPSGHDQRRKDQEAEGLDRRELPHKTNLLLIGPTGCGKTSTLAAFIDLINSRRRDHIVTIEDPVEFGLYRVAMKPDWSDPHYEKLLETNAAMLSARYRLRHVATGDLFRDHVRTRSCRHHRRARRLDRA